MLLEDLFRSKVKVAVLICLAKSSLYSLGVTPKSVIETYGLNTPATYSFFKTLEKEGMVARASNGYVVRGGRGSRLVGFILESLREGDFGIFTEYLRYFRENVPDTMYYIVDPAKYGAAFFGWPERILVIVDKKLKGMIKSPSDVKVIYTSLRGREFRFDWDSYLSYASQEQAFADAFSYGDDPSYIYDVIWYLEQIDVDKMLSLSKAKGLGRLATLLAYYMVITGKKIPSRFAIERLADPDQYPEAISVGTSAILDDRISSKRNI